MRIDKYNLDNLFFWLLLGRIDKDIQNNFLSPVKRDASYKIVSVGTSKRTCFFFFNAKCEVLLRPEVHAT